MKEINEIKSKLEKIEFYTYGRYTNEYLGKLFELI